MTTRRFMTGPPAAIGAAVPWAGALAMWATFTPKFGAIFKDFDLELPVLTGALIEAHESLQG